MKYLKLYEEVNKTISSQDIKDCFADLIDDGFEIYSYFPDLNGKQTDLNNGGIVIKKIINSSDGPIYPDKFNIDDIIETLLFAIPYLQQEYGLINKRCVVNTRNRKQFFITFDEIIKFKFKDVYSFKWNFFVPDNLDIKYSGDKTTF